MRNLVLVLLFAVTSCFLYAQEAGLNIYVGASSGKFTNSAFTPTGMNNTGYTVSGEVRLSEGKSYMVAGVAYHKMNVVASKEAEYFSKVTAMHFLKLKTGIGRRIFNLGIADFHARLVVVADMLNDYPMVTNPLPHKSMNAYSFGAAASVDVYISFISIGLEYEKALTNLIPDNPHGSSKFNIWTLKTGVFF